MRRALEYASMYDRPVIQHAQDMPMTKGGAMNEGYTATRLGIPGMPSVAEDAGLARDIQIAKYTGARYHLAHMSTAGATARSPERVALENAVISAQSSATYICPTNTCVQIPVNLEIVPSGGKTPRNFVLDPSEKWMLVANQNSNLISVFARNPETGVLAEEGKSFAAEKPMRRETYSGTRRSLRTSSQRRPAASPGARSRPSGRPAVPGPGCPS